MRQGQGPGLRMTTGLRQSLSSLGSLVSSKLLEEAKVDIERWGRGRKRSRVLPTICSSHSPFACSHATPQQVHSPFSLGPWNPWKHCIHCLPAPRWVQPSSIPGGSWIVEEQWSLLDLNFDIFLHYSNHSPPHPQSPREPSLHESNPLQDWKYCFLLFIP